jgi:hypothetical protein
MVWGREWRADTLQSGFRGAPRQMPLKTPLRTPIRSRAPLRVPFGAPRRTPLAAQFLFNPAIYIQPVLKYVYVYVTSPSYQLPARCWRSCLLLASALLLLGSPEVQAVRSPALRARG